MLSELRHMVDDEEIFNECCNHEDPANPPDFCEVCFVLNLSDHVSLMEPYFTEETSEEQRQLIQTLWDEHCDIL